MKKQILNKLNLFNLLGIALLFGKFNRSIAQDAMFSNGGGPPVSTSFLKIAGTFPPTPTTSNVLRLGLNYGSSERKLEIFGGGLFNSYHSNSLNILPWMNWQSNRFYALSFGGWVYSPGTVFTNGRRYIATQHNWRSYGATFGLKEATSLINPSFPWPNTQLVENNSIKNAVISFSYPYTTTNNASGDRRSRLVFEKVETDTTNTIADNPLELMTLTADGNLGINTSVPTEKLHVMGNTRFVGNNIHTGFTYDTGDIFSNGRLRIRASSTTTKGLDVVSSANNQIMYTKGAHVYFTILQDPDTTKIYPVYANGKGQLVNGVGINTSDPYVYDTDGNSTLANYGYFGFKSKTDLRFVNGNGYGNAGIIHGKDDNKRGVFEWYNRMGIGGDPDNGLYPTPHKYTTLRLLALNNKTNFGSSSTDTLSPSIVLLCESQAVNDTSVEDSFNQKHLFSVLNTGHVWLGYDAGSAQKPEALVTIGTHAMDCGGYGAGGCFTPKYQLGAIDANGDFLWKFKMGAPELQLGNSTLSDYGKLFEFQGDVIPLDHNSYNLGYDSRRWKNIFSVNVDGTNAYNQSSDFNLKKNINKYTNALEVVNKLEPVTFYWKNENIDTICHYGFIAQDLEKIFGNSIVVKNINTGTLGVRYSELISILAQSIKEQQVILNDQQKLISDQNRKLELLELKITTNSTIVKNTENYLLNKVPMLFQNNPNPFDKKTFIDYFIPDGSTQASIVVSDIQGKIIYSSIINTIGMGRVTLEDEKLDQGTYLYSLYVNGKIIDTKQMIVVKN